jgi:RHS repeat-associated protein
VLASRWFSDRQGPATPAADKRAGTLAATHDSTPMVSLTDALGRVVCTRADNGADGIHQTVLQIGVQGDLRGLTDALGRQVETQVTDAMGRVIATYSADAGDQMSLPAFDGRPVRHWSPLGHASRCEHDPLRRQTHIWVAPPGSTTWALLELTVHGETHPLAAARRLIGQVHRRYDQAGLSRADSYDVGGRLVSGSRQVLRHPDGADWASLDGQPLSTLDVAAVPLLDPEVFAAGSTFDAQGRTLSQTLPDGTVLTIGYDDGGQLASMTGRFGGAGPVQPLVTHSESDAMLRRIRIVQASGTECRFDYDDGTARLARITAHNGPSTLQDLAFTYDPVGNVVQIDDAAQPTVYFAGAVVTPSRTYEYDPLYRLLTAAGREHSSLSTQPTHGQPPIRPLPHPNDVNALRRYTETFSYDKVGNIQKVVHAWDGGGWTRHHAYVAATNRLDTYSLPGDPAAGPYTGAITHDGAGQMTATPSVSSLSWDHAGRITAADLGGGGTMSYDVDGNGTRVRQVWQRTGAMREERIYLGALQIFRRYVSDVLVFERRTVHVVESKRTVALVETVTVDAQGYGGVDSPVLRYQLSDHLGSVAAETDDVGVAISYEEFHPFGTTAVWLARGAAAVSTKRYRYTGRENDDGTGLYNCGERLYAAWLGRWTSPDHAGLSDGANRYSYVNNNPIRLYDPTGRGGEEDLFAKPSSPWSGANWGSASGEQLWFSESKALWAEARATDKGRGFTKGLYDYFRQVHSSWGGPADYALGHQGTPFALLKPGEDSYIAIQSVRSNAVQAGWEKKVADLARKVGIPVRDSSTGLYPGAAGGTRWGQPDVPTFTTIGTTPSGVPEPIQLPLQFGPVKPTGPTPPPMQQLEFNFDLNPGAVKASKTAPVTQDAAALTDASKFAPAAQDAATVTKAAPAVTDATTATKVAPVVNDTVTAAKVTPAVPDTTIPVKGTAGAADTTAVAKVAPVANDTAAITPLAADVKASSGLTSAVTDGAATGAPLVKDAALVQDAAAVAKSDAAVASTLEKGAEAVKAAAPVLKEAAPALKEAGALSKVLGTGSKVLKAVQPVIKVAGPVLRVVGEVAKPLGVITAAVDMASANNNTDRLVAGGDLVAGVSMYCGPVGEAFGAGYTVGGLVDKGIEKASKATLGVDLSPSNGLSYVMDAQDKLVSRIIPDSPDKPSYKNENKIAWFLIDTLGF